MPTYPGLHKKSFDEGRQNIILPLHLNLRGKTRLIIEFGAKISVSYVSSIVPKMIKIIDGLLNVPTVNDHFSTLR